MIPRIKIQNRDKGTMWFKRKIPTYVKWTSRRRRERYGWSKRDDNSFFQADENQPSTDFEVQHIPNSINENNSTSNFIRRKLKNTKGKS